MTGASLVLGLLAFGAELAALYGFARGTAALAGAMGAGLAARWALGLGVAGAAGARWGWKAAPRARNRLRGAALLGFKAAWLGLGAATLGLAHGAPWGLALATLAAVQLAWEARA